MTMTLPIKQSQHKPYLLDVGELAEVFRDKLYAGLKRLARRGELNLESEVDAERYFSGKWVAPNGATSGKWVAPNGATIVASFNL